MKLSGLFQGGFYHWVENSMGPHTPQFVFLVKDVAPVSELLQGMYVDCDVRFNGSDQLAYHLNLPDRQLNLGSIPIQPVDREHLEEGNRSTHYCSTLITADLDSEDRIDLAPFTAIQHDWSGTYASARRAFASHELDEAIGGLTPLLEKHPDGMPKAHQLMGRCFRAKGDLERAIEHYLTAVKTAQDGQGNLLPHAAGVLADLGITFKQLGNWQQAVHCLLHSLHLRPNHPEALVSFVTLFPDDVDLVVYGIARTLAMGRTQLAALVTYGYASSVGRDQHELLELAQSRSQQLDLNHWPFAETRLARHGNFIAGIQDPTQLIITPKEITRKIIEDNHP